MSLAVVILAGGEGSRIGGGKPMRMLGGERLIHRAVRLARGWSDVIAVAVREQGRLAGTVDAELIRDAEGQGPIAGLGAALAFAEEGGFSHVLTIPCDAPFLPPDLAGRLGAVGSAAVAASAGRRHWACGLWPVEARHELDRYVTDGNSSLKGFAMTIGCRSVEWPADVFDPFFNINSEADLRTAETWLDASQPSRSLA